MKASWKGTLCIVCLEPSELSEEHVIPAALGGRLTCHFLCTDCNSRIGKQHLRIKTFLGTSENAVKTQIWIAVCTYVLIAITKKRLHLEHHSLYEILQILSLTMFEQTPINQLLTPPSANSNLEIEPQQLTLL